MSRSPGHQQHPEHKVRESRAEGRMSVNVNGLVVADSRNAVKLDEDGHPARFYFPREDVKMELLGRSDTTTECPFKGHASYFDLHNGGQTIKDAAWSYETPYDEHVGIKEMLAFDESKSAGIHIRSLP